MAMLPILAGCAMLGLIWKPEVSTQVLMMAIGVGTIGLGHGAMDHRVGEILMRRQFRGYWMIVFAVAYLVLAAIGFAGWMVAPGVALTLLLAYSALHFGSDRFQANGLGYAVARGAVPILLPIAIHPVEVSELFSIVSGTYITVEGYVVVAGSMATIAVLLTVVSAFRRNEFVHLLEAVLLVALNFTTSPLIAFTLYFVCLHSIRHIIELAGWLEPDSLAKGFRMIARESLLLTGFIVVAGAIGIAFVQVGDLAPSTIQAVFVGLSCLTIPHMIVTYFGEKHGQTLGVP